MSSNASREAWELIYRLLLEGEGRDRMQSACVFAGVAPGVLKTLIHLDAEEPIAMRDLATFFGVDASYVTSLVDDLERAGLAVRQTHPTDRRVKTIALTPEGIAVQQKVHDLMYEPPKCFAALTAGETRELRDLLAKAVAADPLLAETPAGHHRSHVAKDAGRLSVK